MKKPFISFLILASGLLLTGCSNDEPFKVEAEEPTVTPETPEVVEPLPEITKLKLTAAEEATMDELTSFAFDFNHHAIITPAVTEKTNGNYCLSPASLAICLNLMINSIDAPYDTRIAEFFGFSDADALSSLALKLQAYLPASGAGVVMKLANSVWYSSRYSISDTYRQMMLSTLHVPASALDFTDKAEAIRIINAWCDEQTEGMIKDPVKDLDPQTVVAFANALYFEGTWLNPFDRKLSADATFHGTGGDATVNMMNQNSMLQYADYGGFEYVSLPFDGNNFNLELLMSADGAEITETDYDHLKYYARRCEVDLSLPSFSINWNAGLDDMYAGLYELVDNATLTTMGFPEYVDLAGQKILQSTAFELNEEGARAAAVTDSFWVGSSGGTVEYPQVKVTFDRPFTYIVRDTRSGAIVFIGAVNNF